MVEEGDVIARFDATEMEERLEDGRADLRSAELETRKSEIQSTIRVSELETGLKLAELELDHAERFRKADDVVYSRQDIIESQIDEKLAGQRVEHAASSQDRQQELSRTDLELLAIKKRKAQLTIDQAAQGLQALEVRAPHAGLLTLERGWDGESLQVGSEIWRGQPIGEIPDLSKMEAEVFVLEADAGGLEVGKPAKVIVESDPDTVHPATIRRVDAIAKPRSRRSPVQYFGVTLELEMTDPEVMKPGQRVRATLLLAELDAAVVVPRQTVVQRDGKRQVFVREGDGFVPREVEIGASSMGLVEVTTGLEEGEVIALRPPDEDGDSEDQKTASALALSGAGGSR